mmetsp:Transcript_8075/g.11735  ORF Transcript_8075/g.11735 Transcript_8075/m.11735 type:complete len:884 (+) Transcript_8075:36-2687(+)
MSHFNQELPPPSDNVEEELTRILQALDVVYSPLNNQTGGWNRQLADRYLVRFQSTPVAWMVCDRLLSDPSPQARFFAAQTLHNKCQCDMYQLPETSMPALRDSLMQHLRQAENGPYKTQLALSISALAVQMNWTTVVQDLATIPDALVVLKMLPEECSSSRLIVEDDTLRYMMEDALLSNAKDVLANTSFDLWFTWIRYLPLPAQLLVDSNIVPACLAALNQDEMAVDVLVEVIRLYPSHAPRNQILVESILPLVMQLPLEEALQGDDEDLQRAFCRIFTELGESYLSILLEQDGQAILTKVTQCTSLNDKSISGMTHSFWYRFVMVLEQMDDYRKRQDQVDLYTPHLLQLLDVCLVHLEYPLDDELTDDTIDDFHKERFYLGESIEDCCRLMGGHVVLERIGLRLSSSQTKWTAVEACLYAMQSLAKYIPHDENQFMPQCFALLSQLPADVEPLRFTVSSFIGKYAPWLASHPEHLQPLLPYLAQGLSIPKCASASGAAIRNLCERIPLGESVLELYNQVCGKVELSVELEILEGLCKGLEESLVINYIPHIVGPVGNRLQQKVQDPSSSCKDIINEIDRLTVIMRFLKMPPAKLIEVLEQSWPLLEIAGSKYANEALMAEKVCRLHKHALRTSGTQSYIQVLPTLMSMIVSSFQSSHQAPYLYLASIVVAEYPQNSELNNMIQALCQTSFSFLTNLQDLTNHPDVVEELFYCMGRMIKHCPGPLLNTSPSGNDLLSRLVQFTIVGMELDHKAANRGTYNFLQHFVGYGLENSSAENVKEILRQHGERIVTNLIRALTGDLPAYCIDGGSGSISSLLYQINQIYPNEFQQQWLSSAFMHTRVPEHVKRDLLAASQQRRNQTDFDIAVRSFKAASERFRRVPR